MKNRYFVHRFAAILVGLAFAVTSSSALAAKGAGKERNPEKMAERVMKRNDANRDGSLDESEFKGKSKRFQMVDRNDDGKVDSTELKTALEQRKQNGKGKRGKRGAGKA